MDDDHTWIPNRVIRDPDLSHRAKVLYGVLRMHGDSIIVESINRMRQDSGGCSRITIRRGLRELEDAGLITREQRPGETAVIVLGEV